MSERPAGPELPMGCVTPGSQSPHAKCQRSVSIRSVNLGGWRGSRGHRKDVGLGSPSWPPGPQVLECADGGAPGVGASEGVH